MQGLIPDIYRLLQKYSLMPTLETYLESCEIPRKDGMETDNQKQNVRITNRQRRSDIANKITCRDDLKLFEADRPLTPIVISKTSPSLSVHHKSTKILSMAMSRQFDSKCAICYKFTDSNVNHTLWFCEKTESKRNKLIVELYRVIGHFKCMQFMTLPVLTMSRHLVCLALTVTEDGLFSNFVLLKLICDLF
ncbi:hypothetical protein DPMN_087416 [Dreissena polymorpha]|uniref:Uncharacterized protein n=1 Tax=Dreissena polymorpha TaxID=45954 RepID=A0A9D4QW38_DREPO|nr:hypothetical protein DPMN_087416 [Dreissena polymorpha]